jgi:hypothetical protein
MKKFDLEKAKAGAPVCTRDGKPVRIICYDAKDPNYPIVALVDNFDTETAETYTDDGFWQRDKTDNGLNLMMASTKREGWVNIFKGRFSLGEPMVFGPIWSDEEFARNNAHNCIVTTDGKPDKEYITTTHIEWEE